MSAAAWIRCKVGKELELIRAQSWLIAGTFLAATGAWAQLATTPPPSAYPVSAEVRLAPAMLAKRFNPESAGFPATAASANGIAIGEQTRAAYDAATRRLFQGKGASALIIEVSIGEVDWRTSALGWRVSVDHEVIVREQAGAELRRFRVRGERGLLSSEAGSIEAAFASAADDGARKFEGEFRDSAEIKRWMGQSGIRPVAVRPPWPERGENLMFIEGGGALVGGGDEGGFGLMARVGVAGRNYLAQVAIARSAPQFEPRPIFGTAVGNAELQSTSIGLEVGPAWRLGPYFELHCGAGAHLFWGHASMSYLLPSGDPRFNDGPRQTSFWFTKNAWSLFAALQYTNIVLPRGGRVRAGLEGRAYLGADVPFPELQRSVSPATSMVGLYLGIEIPWKAPPPAKGAP